MPWSCFGGKKKKGLGTEPAYEFSSPPKNEIKSTEQNCLVEKACVQKSSNLVDSAVSSSTTPSTVPAGTSKDTSLTGSPPESPGSVRGALRRAELAQKRREFFKDLMVDEPYFRHKYTNGSATLPTAAMRARNFGEVKLVRPSSQPNSVIPSPTQMPPSAPPGPHLLRPASPNLTSKSETSTFTSPDFINELRGASEEVSRRWQMTDEERDSIPCSFKTKVRLPLEQTSHARESPEIPIQISPNSETPDITIETVVSSSAETTQTLGTTHSSSSASFPSSPVSGENVPPPDPVSTEKDTEVVNSTLIENDVFEEHPVSDVELDDHLVSDDDEFEREVMQQYKVTEPGLDDFPIDGRDVFTDAELQNAIGSGPVSTLEVIPEATQLSEDEHAEESPDPTPSPIETGSVSSENSDALETVKNQRWQEDDSVPLIEDSKNDESPVQPLEPTENPVKTIN